MKEDEKKDSSNKKLKLNTDQTTQSETSPIIKFEKLHAYFYQCLYPYILIQQNYQDILISNIASENVFKFKDFNFNADNLPSDGYVMQFDGITFNFNLHECMSIKRHFDFYKTYTEKENELNNLQMDTQEKTTIKGDENLVQNACNDVKIEEIICDRNNMYRQNIDATRKTNNVTKSQMYKQKETIILDCSSEIEESSSVDTNDEIPLNLIYMLNDQANNISDFKEYLRFIYKKKVVQKKYNYKIYHDDLKTLTNGKWLNDKIINIYLQMLYDQSKTENIKDFFVLSTYFYLQLKNKGIESIKSYGKHNDIFNKKYILIPVHLPGHWIFVLIDTRACTVIPYDSLGIEREKVAYNIKKWIEHEYYLTYNKSIFYNVYIPTNYPKQHNGNDCGVFVIYYAKKIFEGKIIVTKDNKNVNTILLRYQIMHEISVGKILYSTDEKLQKK
ncbi:Sentrin-specific protease 2 [Conglomerata obtusa]